MEQGARVAGGDCASDDASGIASESGASGAVVAAAATAALAELDGARARGTLAELDGARARGTSGSGAERASGVRDDARSGATSSSTPLATPG